MSFYGDSSVDVLVVLVEVYPLAQDVHRLASGVAQVVAVEQAAHDDAGEDVACAWELHGNLVVGKKEMLVGEMVVTHHGMVTVHDARGDEHGVGTDGSQLVHQSVSRFLADALLTVRLVGEQASLGVVRKTEVGHAEHLPHAAHRALVGSAIELAVVSHHGVHVDFRALRRLFTAVASHHSRLFLRSHETRGDGVEVNAELVPFLHSLLDVGSALQDGVLAIGEGVADEHRGQVEHIVPHVGEDGHLHGCGNLAVSAHVADNEYVAFCFHN